MKRSIIKIDEELCNGCGDCVPNCHEGALQIIDGKARLISDLFCDGLGACIGHCPMGAIEIEEREAEPYDEVKTLKENIIPSGKNTLKAHLQHLKDHGETGYLKEAAEYLEKEGIENPLKEEHTHHGGGCPGSAQMNFDRKPTTTVDKDVPSELTQWPVQLHLINPQAQYFQGADILIAADCTAFAYGKFHGDFIKDKKVIIACPKLDSDRERYIEKITNLINNSNINTLTVAIMEVPCCFGLLQLVGMAMQKATRKVPVKKVVISIKGEIITNEWM